MGSMYFFVEAVGKLSIRFIRKFFFEGMGMSLRQMFWLLLEDFGVKERPFIIYGGFALGE